MKINVGFYFVDECGIISKSEESLECRTKSDHPKFAEPIQFAITHTANCIDSLRQRVQLQMHLIEGIVMTVGGAPFD